MDTTKQTVLLGSLGVILVAILLPAAVMTDGLLRYVFIGIMVLYVSIMGAVLGAAIKAAHPHDE